MQGGQFEKVGAMKRGSVPGVSGLLAVGLLVTGCAGGGGGGGEQAAATTPAATGATAVQSPTGTDETSAATSTSSPGTVLPASSGGAVDELRDGTWQVGDAGEVEFALEGGALSLTEVRPAEGWQHRVADEQPDEIEAHFTRDATDWKFEVELDAETMEISKELEIEQAEGGTYQVGSAAEVSFDTDGSTVTLGDVRTNDGWTVVKQDESTDDIEIDFSNDIGGSAEFEVEAEDTGVGLEIDQKLTGSIPG